MFDYDTISDVVLHMRFTAREGGDPQRTAALKRLSALTTGHGTATRVRLFSLRHEFSNAWAPFAASAGPAAPITLTLTREMFPYWSAQSIRSIESVAVYRPPATPGDELELLTELHDDEAPTLGSPWTPSFDPTSKDLWLLATWKA
jgi:hypothetical protein